MVRNSIIKLCEGRVMNELISVIIPVYNKEKYIDETLSSLLKQTYKNIEIIIVNDGSTDNTAEIIDDYASKYDNIKVYHQENTGVTKARLNGIKQSSGEWIGFVDADDFVQAEMYETLLSNANKYDADISHCGCVMISEDGTQKNYFYNTKRVALQNNAEGLHDLVCGTVYEPSLCNKIFKRELSNGLINSELMDLSIKINEDLLMNYWLFKNAKKSIYEDVCMYHYISTANSASKTKFTTDPLKVLKIIHEDSPEVIKDVVLSRIARQLISTSTMPFEKDNEKRNKYIKESRAELRRELKNILKAKISISVKIMSLWTALWPWSYRIAHHIIKK